MDITDAIRGDDHLTNAFRQTQLFRALDWTPPRYSHIPLIHGADGAKLSKRHGALGVEAYRDMGILPEALNNALLRLGWSHGDEEIIGRDQAIEWFDLDGIGRGAARFDMARLTSLNAHYIQHSEPARLVALIRDDIEAKLASPLDDSGLARLEAAMPGLKPRAKNLIELAENAVFYVAARKIPLDAKAAKILDEDARSILGGVAAALGGLGSWNEVEIEAAIRGFAEGKGLKLGGVAQPLRAALSGSTVSPGVFEVAAVLGRNETLGRLGDVAGG